MPRRTRYLIALLALMMLSALFGYLWRDVEPDQPALPPHSYVKALRQAHDGQPGAARVLYQQLQRHDLPAIRRAALYAELPNYPSALAFKLAQADLDHADAIVRRAAVSAISRLLPGTAAANLPAGGAAHQQAADEGQPAGGAGGHGGAGKPVVHRVLAHRRSTRRVTAADQRLKR